MPKRKPQQDSDREKSHDEPASKRRDELITTLNAVSTRDFKEAYIKTSDLSPPLNATLTFHSSADLSKAELTGCLNLISSTSKQHYETSSWGWSSRRKTRELREPEMRYLLVRSEPTGEIDGFLSFMLTHDSSPPVPVLYVYEIHLAPALRKVGLGRHLMQVVEGLAQRVGMETVMLTCFVSNEAARKFYEGRGYERDVVSPEDRRTRKKIVKADYLIMSKAVS